MRVFDMLELPSKGGKLLVLAGNYLKILDKVSLNIEFVTKLRVREEDRKLIILKNED
jgi:hypothetical protein